MALGSLTGGGMFVGCVVAGRILTLNNGAKARWAQIRDVTFYLASVVTVAGIGGRAGVGAHALLKSPGARHWLAFMVEVAGMILCAVTLGQT